MKLVFLSLIMCVSGLFATEASSQIAKVTIHSNQLSALKLIEEIENQTDYLFVYNNDEIDLNRKINVHVTDKIVAEVLSKAFSNTNVVYAMEGNNIMLMKKTSNNNAVSQQNTKKVTGTVTDSRGEAVIGANVVVKGSTNGTITDLNGNFSLDVANNDVLVVSFIGYVSQEKPIKGQSVINILIVDDTQKLDEIVVVVMEHKKNEV